MSEPTDAVRFRPRRLRVFAWAGAAAVTVAAVVLALVMPGGTATAAAGFGVVDRVALVGLGLVGAGGLLLLTRPVVVADSAGVRVRNLLGEVSLSWGVVRAVRFEPGASWATLELRDDDVVGVLAVQSVDREHALAAVRSLRALHAAHQRGPG